MNCALAETTQGLLMQEKERLEFTPAPKSKRARNHKRFLRPNVDRWEMFDRGDPTSSGHSIPTNLSSHYRRQTYCTSLQCHRVWVFSCFVRGLLSTSMRELAPACNLAAGRLCSCIIDVAVAARRKRHAERGATSSPSSCTRE